MRGQVDSQSNLAWMIIRNNNAFLMKRRNIKKPFSTEPMNLLNIASYRYNGLVHKKSIGIESPSDKKGFTFVFKRPKNFKKPAQSKVSITMRGGPRRSLHRMKRQLRKNNYRRDLIMASLRRASAILASHKRMSGNRKKHAKKTE